jgi:hypothetical protein
MTRRSVVELQGAWRSVQAEEFATAHRRLRPVVESRATIWVPSSGERVVAVVGCAGGVGASTLSLALATATGVPARVVECCPALGSGFSAAATAELGVRGGWRRGRRGSVVLERRSGDDQAVPLPVLPSIEWTILDTSWATLLDRGPSWLRSILRTMDNVVLVTRATVPGLRSLESCADLLAREAVGVVLGPSARRWPRPVRVAAAALPRQMRLVDFPLDPRLHVTGLTPDPLSAPLLRAAETVLALLGKEAS